MRNNRKLRQLERRVAALEKLHAQRSVRVEISPQPVDFDQISQILDSRNNPKETDDRPQGTQ